MALPACPERDPAAKPEAPPPRFICNHFRKFVDDVGIDAEAGVSPYTSGQSSGNSRWERTRVWGSPMFGSLRYPACKVFCSPIRLYGIWKS